MVYFSISSLSNTRRLLHEMLVLSRDIGLHFAPSAAARCRAALVMRAAAAPCITESPPYHHATHHAAMKGDYRPYDTPLVGSEEPHASTVARRCSPFGPTASRPQRPRLHHISR